MTMNYEPEIREAAKILSRHRPVPLVPTPPPPRPAKCILQEMIFSKNSASLITTILFHEMNKIDMIYICYRQNWLFFWRFYRF